MTEPDARFQIVHTVHSRSPQETQRWGECLGRALAPGQIVALCGDLGAGKTTLTQGIAAGLGIRGRVTSPTFTLVNEYGGAAGIRLVHADSYRLGDSAEAALSEAATFGMDEMLDDPGAVIVIEWAERVQSLLPSDYLLVELRMSASDPEAREIRCSASGPAGRATLARLAGQPGPDRRLSRGE